MSEPVLNEDIGQGLDQEVEVSIGEEREVPCEFITKYCPSCKATKGIKLPDSPTYGGVR
jgi:hypothetical protein